MSAAKKIVPLPVAHESRVQQLYCVWSSTDEATTQLGRGLEDEDTLDHLTDVQLRTAEEMAAEKSGSLDDIMLKLAIWAKANLPEHDPTNPYNSIVVSALADLQSYCAKQVDSF